MFSEIWKFTKTLVTLADDLQKYHSEIKDIRQDLRDLTIIVNRLAQEIKHTKETTAGERANMLLQVENQLLKFQNRLPPPETDRMRAHVSEQALGVSETLNKL
jgi:hypothetical protein